MWVDIGKQKPPTDKLVLFAPYKGPCVTGFLHEDIYYIVNSITDSDCWSGLQEISADDIRDWCPIPEKQVYILRRWSGFDYHSVCAFLDKETAEEAANFKNEQTHSHNFNVEEHDICSSINDFKQQYRENKQEQWVDAQEHLPNTARVVELQLHPELDIGVPDTTVPPIVVKAWYGATGDDWYEDWILESQVPDAYGVYGALHEEMPGYTIMAWRDIPA